MTDATNRFGNALLSLTTLRAPDAARGAGIKHFDLLLPNSIAAEVDAFNRGTRATLTPRDAAGMLWALPAATILSGEPDAWLHVPGVWELDACVRSLATLDQADWPKDQDALRAYLIERLGDNATWEDVSQRLRDAGTLGVLNDLLLIFKYAALGQSRPLLEAAGAFRLAATLLADDGPDDANAVAAWLVAPLVVPSVFVRSIATGPRKPPATPPNPTRPPRPHIDPVILGSSEVIGHIESAIAAGEAKQRTSRVEEALRTAGVTDARARALVDRALNQTPAGGEHTDGDVDEPALRLMARANPRPVRRTGIATLHLFGAPVMLNVGEMQARQERQKAQFVADVTAALPEALRARLLTTAVPLDQLTVWPTVVAAVQATPSYLEPVGRNDLLLVRHSTTGYRRAEIAYVENILIGETRSRTHTDRILDRQEFFEESERTTEESRDLQVTDRAELSREVENVVNQDLRAQGNVQVTSRGPTTVVASAGVSFDRSTHEAAKAAEKYSRETIERAVKKTTERVVRQSRSIYERETTEQNAHSFTRESKASDHVSGVYQYLERVSRAKIFWYGERELYDLVIPEPASLIWQFAISRPELQIAIEAPDEELFNSITLDNLRGNREAIIRAFKVTDMPPAPDEAKTMSVSFPATGGGDSAKYATTKEIQIPDGYVAWEARFTVSAEVEDSDDTPNGGVIIGDEVLPWNIHLTDNQGSTDHSFALADLAGPTLSIGLHADNFTSLAAAVTVKLKLSDAAREQWALTAYARVSERFEQLRKEYAQAVIQASANQPSSAQSLPDGSMLYLQQIVRAELQRAAIDVMRNEPVNYDNIDAFPYAKPDGSMGSQPVADLAALRSTEPEIRFLQQAFEWEHLGWILYPYFWGRRSEWSRTVVAAHPDPDFTAFLNAGAARVQIPVRPGFEAMVKHFMETREVYLGQGMPKIGDPGYVAFIDEQMTSLGAPGDEVPWPPDNPREWDIVAPTSLVMVRSTAEPRLPRWDPDDGSEIPPPS